METNKRVALQQRIHWPTGGVGALPPVYQRLPSLLTLILVSTTKISDCLAAKHLTVLSLTLSVCCWAGTGQWADHSVTEMLAC